MFVFALTQVTFSMAESTSTSQGALRGVLIVMLRGGRGPAYAWLANVVSADEPVIKLAILVGMSAMFVLALCIPEAFEDAEGGLDGPVVLAICYLTFRVAAPGRRSSRGPRGRGPARGSSLGSPRRVGSGIVLLVASHSTAATQTALWALALGADYPGTDARRGAGWRSPRHRATSPSGTASS